jgi:hypothetical protein
MLLFREVQMRGGCLIRKTTYWYHTKLGSRMYSIVSSSGSSSGDGGSNS